MSRSPSQCETPVASGCVQASFINTYDDCEVVVMVAIGDKGCIGKDISVGVSGWIGSWPESASIISLVVRGTVCEEGYGTEEASGWSMG